MLGRERATFTRDMRLATLLCCQPVSASHAACDSRCFPLGVPDEMRARSTIHKAPVCVPFTKTSGLAAIVCRSRKRHGRRLRCGWSACQLDSVLSAKPHRLNS
jgi:hypothetical protein